MRKWFYGCRGCGKDALFTLHCLKRLCIRYYGIGFIFATPKVRSILLETMNDFLNELCECYEGIADEKQ